MSLNTKPNSEKTNVSEVKAEPLQIVRPYIDYSRTHIKGENLEGKERVAGLGPPSLSPSTELLRQRALEWEKMPENQRHQYYTKAGVSQPIRPPEIYRTNQSPSPTRSPSSARSPSSVGNTHTTEEYGHTEGEANMGRVPVTPQWTVEDFMRKVVKSHGVQYKHVKDIDPDENSQGHVRQDNEGPNDENGKDMGVEAQAEKSSDSLNNSQIDAADKVLKIVDNQLTKLQSQLTGIKRSIEDLKGVKESIPKKAKYDLPVLLVRAEDPFDASAFDGLDEIAARELYNWQGIQAPRPRERLSGKKIATLKKETQVRIEEHRKHEAELAKCVMKISEIAGINLTLDGDEGGPRTVPEPPNPNTGVQQPKPLKYNPREKLDRSKPYRSDNQTMVAIKHWHYGKQYPGDENTWSLIFEDQSARLIGVGEERGIRQQPSDEYWDTLDKVIRDWYGGGIVDNVAMAEAKPFDDQFDVFPEGFPIPDPPKVGSFGVPPIVQSAAKDHTPKRPSPLGRRLIEGMKKSTPSKPKSSKPTSSMPKSSKPAATKMSTKRVKLLSTERVTSSNKEVEGPIDIEDAKGTGTNARLDYVDDDFLADDDLDEGLLMAAPTPQRTNLDDGDEGNLYGDYTQHKKGPRSTGTIKGERPVSQPPTGSHRRVAKGIVTEVREDADATIPGFDDELYSDSDN
jgi:hypothetical protein